MVGIDIYSIFLPKDHCVLALGPQEDEGGAPSLLKTLQQDNRGGRFNSPRLSQIKICNVLLPESIENEFRWWRQAFQVDGNQFIENLQRWQKSYTTASVPPNINTDLTLGSQEVNQTPQD